MTAALPPPERGTLDPGRGLVEGAFLRLPFGIGVTRLRHHAAALDAGHRTPDIGGTATTDGVTDAVIAELRR